MSDPDHPVPPGPPTQPPAESLSDRPLVPGARAEPSGASFGAVILFICSFLSLLSTGCFGLFAIGIHEGGAWAFFGAGAIVMAFVTWGFFLGARALQRRAGKK